MLTLTIICTLAITGLIVFNTSSLKRLKQVEAKLYANQSETTKRYDELNRKLSGLEASLKPTEELRLARIELEDSTQRVRQAEKLNEDLKENYRKAFSQILLLSIAGQIAKFPNYGSLSWEFLLDDMTKALFPEKDSILRLIWEKNSKRIVFFIETDDSSGAPLSIKVTSLSGFGHTTLREDEFPPFIWKESSEIWKFYQWIDQYLQKMVIA